MRPFPASRRAIRAGRLSLPPPLPAVGTSRAELVAPRRSRRRLPPAPARLPPRGLETPPSPRRGRHELLVVSRRAPRAGFVRAAPGGGAGAPPRSRPPCSPAAPEQALSARPCTPRLRASLPLARGSRAALGCAAGTPAALPSPPRPVRPAPPAAARRLLLGPEHRRVGAALFFFPPCGLSALLTFPLGFRSGSRGAEPRGGDTLNDAAFGSGCPGDSPRPRGLQSRLPPPPPPRRAPPGSPGLILSDKHPSVGLD